MAVCGIYKITNIITHKCYIGQSKDIFRRWREHMKNQYKDIDWHTTMQSTPENYSFEIITQCEPEDLNDLENYYIHLYDSVNNGYNQRMEGSSAFNVNMPMIYEEVLAEETTWPSRKDFPYSMDDITRIVQASSQSIYARMKKNKEFFERNSLRNGKKKWYNQKILNYLLEYYGPRKNI